MDIVGGIAAASQALGIAKALRGIEKDYDAATYKVQIVDLIDALTDAKIALTDAREALGERDKEIDRLKASFAAKAKLVKSDGDYNYVADDEGNPVGYPVCPKCEEVDGRIIQLKQDGGSIQGRCPACSSTYRPVTCFLPRQEGGYATKADADKAKRDAESARMAESLRRFGNRLA